MSDKHYTSRNHIQLQIIDEQAMTELGAQLAGLAVAGIIIYLDGDLGAGKTTLVRGFLRALGYQGAVKSPTFTVVEPYSLDYNNIYDYNKLQQGLKPEDNIDSGGIESDKVVNGETVNSVGHEDSKPHTQKIYHFDLYRLEDPEELEYLGIRDYLDGQAIALIEWPEKGAGILPEADLIIKITHQEQGRGVELLSQTTHGAVIVSKLISDTTRQVDV